jgi:hypothetical protein
MGFVWCGKARRRKVGALRASHRFEMCLTGQYVRYRAGYDATMQKQQKPVYLPLEELGKRIAEATDSASRYAALEDYNAQLTRDQENRVVPLPQISRLTGRLPFRAIGYPAPAISTGARCATRDRIAQL